MDSTFLRNLYQSPNNPDFDKLLSDRLRNTQYKQLYLRSLFSFINMRHSTDRRYLMDSKAYLISNLSVILNHFTMEQLKNIGSLSEEDLERLAYFMNCSKDQVHKILSDMGVAFEDMR